MRMLLPVHARALVGAPYSHTANRFNMLVIFFGSQLYAQFIVGQGRHRADID